MARHFTEVDKVMIVIAQLTKRVDLLEQDVKKIQQHKEFQKRRKNIAI